MKGTTACLASGQRVKLYSYGGEYVHCLFCAPEDEEALRGVLAHARTEGLRVTFRTGGQAFDTQSLNRVLVVSLTCFDAIEVDVENARLRVGAGASWGRILQETSPHGLVPYVMVTSSEACAGGTMAADCLSRFSPTLGKEGEHVRAFEMMTMDGRVLRCSRQEHPQIFRAVISGLGYLGAVIRIEYDLLRLGYGGRRLAVRSEIERFDGLADLAERLVPKLEAEYSEPAQVACGERAPVALAAAVYLGTKRQGLLVRATYADTTRRRRTFLHRPRHLFHRIAQALMLFSQLRHLLWWITLNVMFRKNQVYFDDLEGFTFFQDGNAWVKRTGRKLGLRMGTRQQTYVIPWSRRGRGPREHLREFLREADAVFDDAGLVPALIDVLYIPPDRGEGFLLSATRATGGFAISFAFESSDPTRLGHIERALARVAVLCGELDGRVHLVKHVFAAPELLERMYPEWRALRDLKQTLDPDSLLVNEFLIRVFPSLVEGAAGPGTLPSIPQPPS